MLFGSAMGPGSMQRALAFIVGVAVWPFPGKRAAAAVSVAAAAELALLVCHPCGFWQNGGLDWSARLGLVAVVWLYWTALAWVAYGLLAVYRASPGDKPPRTTARLLTLATRVILAAWASSYLLCWLLFWRLGEFPDGDSLYFALLNRGMLVRYLLQSESSALALLVTAVLAAAAASFLATGAVRRRCQADGGTSQPSLMRGLFVILLAANATWLAVDYARFSTQPDMRPQNWIEAGRDPWPPFAFELRFHVNPHVALISGFALGEQRDAAGELSVTSLEPIRADGALSSDANRPDASHKDNFPNIVVITVESLRSDVIFKRHQDKLVVPNLNELARTGCFFPNCYSQSTHSDYSDPAILCSLYPLRTPRQHFYQRTDPWPKVLIYDVLKDHGYDTAMFSSQNEAWSSMDRFYESAKLDTFFDSRSYDGPTYASSSYFGRWMEVTRLAGKLDDAVTMQAAVDWIDRQQSARRPFFVSLNLQSPHFPYRLPRGEAGPFQPAFQEGDASFVGYSEESAVEMQNAYFNALHYADSQIGLLLDYLEQSGLRGQTILAVTGDHGEAFYENGEATHADIPLETTTKVGLIVNSPERVKPAVDPYLAQCIDIPPTLLGVAGLAAHPAFQGEDLFSPHRPPLEERLVFIHCRNPRVNADAVISGTGWKYLIDRRRQTSRLNFRPTDLESHPNLVSAEPEVARTLAELLDEWRRRQLLYYQRPRYYTWFYAPPTPVPSSDVRRLLKRAAARYVEDG